MIIRNIQQRLNVRCRMCEQEILFIAVNEIPYPTTSNSEDWTITANQRKLRIKQLREQRSSKIVYGLQGMSAGRYFIEAICEDHLIIVRDNIEAFLKDPSRTQN